MGQNRFGSSGKNKGKNRGQNRGKNRFEPISSHQNIFQPIYLPLLFDEIGEASGRPPEGPAAFGR